MSQPPHEITHLIAQLSVGDEAAVARLTPILYDELRRLAQFHMGHERPDHTLSATALVHEAYLKLAGSPSEQAWKDRAHFVAIASRAMRQILADHARRRARVKHGGNRLRVSLDHALGLFNTTSDSEDVLALEAALTQLEAMDPIHARIVECRYYGALTIEETAVALGTSASSVKRGWRSARVWLYRELHGS